MLLPGDPVPSFFARGATNPNYAFDSVAGRNVALLFIGSTHDAGMQQLIDQLFAAPEPFDDVFASAFIISSDLRDEAEDRLRERYPGLRVFWDSDRKISRLFGGDIGPDSKVRRTVLLDPGLRVHRILPITDPATHFATLSNEMVSMGAPAETLSGWAPVLEIPRVLEPELCQEFIEYARKTGFEESGYMRTDPATGQTKLVVNHKHKRRSDCTIEDQRLRQLLQERIKRRLIPQIERAFQFTVTRMERYLVAAYDADVGAHFRPHKDNTTLGTAHRRFAVTINLNSDDYDGGDLRFPEFGPRTYRAPSGGAIVFSCSLLHEATPITRGTRYCILPFLYDEAAASLRLRNAKHLADENLRKDVIASVSAVPPALERGGANGNSKKNRRLRFR
jgi:predicted 2-oxoglutarate/Fe(II)-dependent dioxygenase YbiX